MISWKETDLSGCYKRSDDVDLLVGSLHVHHVFQGVVERDKRLSCASTTICHKVLVVLIATEKFLLIIGKRFNGSHEISVDWFLSFHLSIRHPKWDW